MAGLQDKKLTKQERQYQKITRLNQQLTDEYNKPKVPISQASESLLSYVQNTEDPLLPSLWGNNRADPYAEKVPSASCCAVM